MKHAAWRYLNLSNVGLDKSGIIVRRIIEEADCFATHVEYALHSGMQHTLVPLGSQEYHEGYRQGVQAALRQNPKASPDELNAAGAAQARRSLQIFIRDNVYYSENFAKNWRDFSEQLKAEAKGDIKPVVELSEEEEEELFKVFSAIKRVEGQGLTGTELTSTNDSPQSHQSVQPLLAEQAVLPPQKSLTGDSDSYRSLQDDFSLPGSATQSRGGTLSSSGTRARRGTQQSHESSQPARIYESPEPEPIYGSPEPYSPPLSPQLSQQRRSYHSYYSYHSIDEEQDVNAASLPPSRKQSRQVTEPSSERQQRKRARLSKATELPSRMQPHRSAHIESFKRLQWQDQLRRLNTMLQQGRQEEVQQFLLKLPEPLGPDLADELSIPL